jgi:hypothetical protein
MPRRGELPAEERIERIQAERWISYPRAEPRRREPTTGKVIPELKFVFWQKMFTGRHDVRVWDPHLRRVWCSDPSLVIGTN